MATALQVLIDARKRIENPANWCKEWFAQNAHGKDCDENASEACAWCASGALYVAASGDKDALFGARNKLAEVVAPHSVPWFNDHHTHDEVLAAFDRAIAAEQKKAAEQ